MVITYYTGCPSYAFKFAGLDNTYNNNGIFVVLARILALAAKDKTPTTGIDTVNEAQAKTCPVCGEETLPLDAADFRYRVYVHTGVDGWDQLGPDGDSPVSPYTCKEGHLFYLSIDTPGASST